MTLYQSFRKYIKKRNIQEVDGSTDGTSVFIRYNELFYAFLYDTDDPYYFRLVLPRIADYNEIQEADINKFALEKSGEYKICKLVVIDNNIWASFEQIILNPDAENDYIYDAALRILSSIQRTLRDYINSKHTT